MDRVFDILDRVFNITPDNATGVLFGLLVIFVGWQGYQNYRLQEKVQDILEENIKGVTEQNMLMQSLSSKLRDLIAKVENESDFLAEKIDHVKEVLGKK